jgi:hypothetical protein
MTARYLEKAWGDSVENPTIKDVQIAISETIEMDDEHGAFWIGCGDEEETVLETHRDLSVIGIFAGPPEQQIKARFQNWMDIEEIYKVLLSGDFDQVKAILTTNS